MNRPGYGRTTGDGVFFFLSYRSEQRLRWVKSGSPVPPSFFLTSRTLREREKKKICSVTNLSKMASGTAILHAGTGNRLEKTCERQRRGQWKGKEKGRAWELARPITLSHSHTDTHANLLSMSLSFREAGPSFPFPHHKMKKAHTIHGERERHSSLTVAWTRMRRMEERGEAYGRISFLRSWKSAIK